MAFQISLTSNSSEIIREYNPDGIVLKGAYEVGLKHFVFWNTIYNITPENNVLILIDPTPHSDPNSNEIQTTHRYEVSIEPGYYEIDDIILQLKKSEFIEKSRTLIELVKHTLKVKIKSNWAVDFTSPNSIGKVLGFSNKRIIEPGKQVYSDIPVNIFSINTVKVHCNLIRANIEDLKRNTHVLYDFPLDDHNIGGKIIKEPNNICYFTVNTSVIHELVIRITDQDNKLIDFRGEQVNLTLNFRPQ